MSLIKSKLKANCPRCGMANTVNFEEEEARSVGFICSHCTGRYWVNYEPKGYDDKHWWSLFLRDSQGTPLFPIGYM